MGLFLLTFSWILGDEFYWYIARVGGSNQLTREKAKKGFHLRILFIK
jgi:hypothetical protein